MPSSTSERRARVAVVVSGWPRLSETFALHELEALRDAGVLAAVFATKPGDATRGQPGTGGIDVTVLAPGTPSEQARALAAALAGRRVTGVHGYFAHQPAEVAALVAGQVGVPYGFSAHALDVRKVAPDDLAARARGAATVLACNADVAASLGALGVTPQVVGHGVDTDRFRPPGQDRDRPHRLAAVGRLVEKKGFDVLIAALARAGAPWQLDVVGAGPERHHLGQLVDRLDLHGRVRFVGPLTHDELPGTYQRADVVVVPSRVDGRNDRDGLPNVVLEAMASGRAIVASDVAAIGTAVVHGKTGLLVPPDDPDRLAAALDRLAADDALRVSLGRRARVAAVADHDLAACGRRFVATITGAYREPGHG
jgi:glycosyltransferase involved in cell wall biosynthesis